MSQDPFRYVQPGESIKSALRATTWNALMDAAKKARGSQHSIESEDALAFRQGDIIRVLNDSGTGLGRFSVLGVDSPVFDPAGSTQELTGFLNHIVLACVTPNEADHLGRFIVLLEPAAAGAIARAYVSGVCPVLVNVTSDSHSCADIADGDYNRLQSRSNGSAQMLWREGGTGEQWAYIRFGTPCGGSGSSTPVLTDCDCPDPPYAITIDCAPCFGQQMPRFWWLDIFSPAYNEYAYEEEYCYDVDCAQIPELFLLRNVEDCTTTYSYGLQWFGASNAYEEECEYTCLWSGTKRCFTSELSTDGAYWYVKIYDREGCLLAVFRKPVEEFLCCETNEGWEALDGYTCAFTIRLRPHECTQCCNDAPYCPPYGYDVCQDTDCCFEACDFDVSVSALATPPGEPGNPPGPPQQCGGMNGVYPMTWNADCSWTFNGCPSGATTCPISARLTLALRTWTLKIYGPQGQVAVLRNPVPWDCISTVVELELVLGESTCLVGGLATFNIPVL